MISTILITTALTTLTNRVTEMAINTFLSDWFLFIILGIVLQMEWRSRYIIPDYQFKQSDDDSHPQIWVEPEFHMNQRSHNLGYIAVIIFPIGYGTIQLVTNVYEYQLFGIGGVISGSIVAVSIIYCIVKIFKGKTLRRIRLDRDEELMKQKQRHSNQSNQD